MLAKPFSPYSTSEAEASAETYEHFDTIILALPAFAHENYLNSIAPYLSGHPDRPPTTICAAVAQGGFDMAVRAALAAANVTTDHVVIAGLETLPWACRLISQGSECEILGTKSEVDVAVAYHLHGGTGAGEDAKGLQKRHIHRAFEQLQAIVGSTPRLRLASGFLGVSLMNINSLWHPTLMYHRWKNWNGKDTFETPPLFYEGATDEVGDTATALSEEVGLICDVLKARYPGTLSDDLTTVRKAHAWFLRAYGDEPNIDRTSVTTMLRTNPAYMGLTHPMRPVQVYDAFGSAVPDPKPKLMPDFHHRYLCEDIPYGEYEFLVYHQLFDLTHNQRTESARLQPHVFPGLVVTRGIAELAGVPTPQIDAIIMWMQEVTGLKYLVESKPGAHSFSETDVPGTNLRMNGNDVARSRCPQRYGYFNLDWFMKFQGYLQEKSSEADLGAKERACALDITEHSKEVKEDATKPTQNIGREESSGAA